MNETATLGTRPEHPEPDGAIAEPVVDAVVAELAPILASKVGAFRREHRLPGVAAGIATRDGLRWWHGAGFADPATGRRPDERTLYRIASISKTITATTVLQLRDEGRLGLDDPAVRHLPELAAVADPFGSIEALTIRRLLQHTSGLQGEAPWQDTDRIWMYRPAELLAALPLARVATPPEVDHKYSNLGFELLGLIVARIAGVPFPQHARATVLDPLGMRDTVWHPDEEQSPRRAVGHDARARDDRPPVARDIASDTATADGGLWSTLEDLGRWVAQQLRADPALERGPGQVLAGRTLAEMHRPTFASKPDLTEAQGLCWYATRKGETILVGHSGALWGFLSNVSFSAAGRVGAIVLLNGVGPASTLARTLVEAVLPAIREADDRVPLAAPPEPAPDAWRELLGTYRDPEFGTDIVVDWRDGRLVIVGDPTDGEPDHPLEPTSEPLVFTIRDGRPGGEPLVFGRGADGRIDRCNAAGYPAMRVDLLAPPTWR
jgi:CubicO group peptidase (beta-lactamase class C family)